MYIYTKGVIIDSDCVMIWLDEKDEKALPLHKHAKQYYDALNNAVVHNRLLVIKTPDGVMYELVGDKEGNFSHMNRISND